MLEVVLRSRGEPSERIRMLRAVRIDDVIEDGTDPPRHQIVTKEGVTVATFTGFDDDLADSRLLVWT